MSPLLPLTADERAAVINATRPIARRDRDEFLRALADELSRHPNEIVPGFVHRIARNLQRRFCIPPNLDGVGTYE